VSLLAKSTYLNSNSFTVKLVWKSGFTILADATAAQVETAFNTSARYAGQFLKNADEGVRAQHRTHSKC
jgi:subtilase family serine protease